MIFAILNGSRIDGFINCSSQDAPVGAVDASDLSDWQRANNSYVTWNGTGWIVDPNLPSPPTPPSPLQTFKRIWNFLGDIITQDASAVNITGGTIANVALSNVGLATANLTTSVPITAQTLTNIGALSFPIGANETWTAEIYLRTGSSSVAGIQVGFAIPAGAAIKGNNDCTTTASSVRAIDEISAGSTAGLAFNTVANQLGRAAISIRVVNGATAGVVQLQGLKVTSGTATFRADSYLVARKN
jgi:hypothetical protein